MCNQSEFIGFNMIYELDRCQGLMVYLQLPTTRVCTKVLKCALMCTEKK